MCGDDQACSVTMGLASPLRAVAQFLACAQLMVPATVGAAAVSEGTPLACEETVKVKSTHVRQAVLPPAPAAPEQPPTVLWNVTELLLNKYGGD